MKGRWAQMHSLLQASSLYSPSPEIPGVCSRKMNE
jgi:hypothetical protein